MEPMGKELAMAPVHRGIAPVKPATDLPRREPM